MSNAAVLGRSCADCTLCCRLLAVAELAKEPLEPCRHCTAGSGCGIYPARPTECRQFFCQYLLDPTLDEAWRPTRSHMVVALDEYHAEITIHCDPEHALLWQQQPYASTIARWNAEAARTGGKVVIWIGDAKITLTPQNDEGAAPGGSDASADASAAPVPAPARFSIRAS